MIGRFPTLVIARRFSAELRPHAGRMVLVGLVSLLGVLFGILKPWPIQWIFDGALVPTGKTSLAPSTVVWSAVAAALVFAAGEALAQYARDVQSALISQRVTRGLRYRIFEHLSRLSPRFFSRNKSGDLLVRLMGDAPVVTTMLVESSVEVVSRVVLIAGTVLIMFRLDFWLTAGLLITLPAILVVVRWIAGRITIAVRKARRKEGALADYLHEAIALAPAIQSLGGTDHVVRRFAQSNRRSERAGLKAKRLAARMSVAVESLLGLAFAGALLFGSLRVMRSQGDPEALTPGELLVYLAYVRSLIRPVRGASRHADRFAKGAACGERVLAVLDTPPEVASEPGAPPAPEAPGELRFEGVTYAYDDRGPAVRDVSVAFRRGELTLLTGRSGAGKSTLAGLALRLMDPDAGEVRLDGASLRDLDLASVRERVGLCLQQAVLFGDTLRENLLVARPEASDEELLAACRDAGVADFLPALQDGLETRLGASGTGLSGGQRQRLSLARTLLRGTSVLVVDEPFAGLDDAAAHGVSETMRRLSRERVVIVVAHDAPDISVFDRVVVLEDGGVLADGLAAGAPSGRLGRPRTSAETLR